MKKEQYGMLKSQDCIILLKHLAHPGQPMPQRQLAMELKISLSEVNAGIKRLLVSGLMMQTSGHKVVANTTASKDFLIYGLKYVFAGKLGEYTVGMPTAVAAPIFADKIALGSDPLPVWPDAFGDMRGVALEPLYPSIPKALREYPDQNLYDLLVLVDAIRIGRARERNLAIHMLQEILDNEK